MSPLTRIKMSLIYNNETVKVFMLSVTFLSFQQKDEKQKREIII